MENLLFHESHHNHILSRGKLPIQNHLYNHKLGTQYPVTKVTSDDVTMMTSWWNTSGTFIMSKISDRLRHHDVTGHWKWVKYQKLHFSYQNLVHCTILRRRPVMRSKWRHDSRTSLECFECQKYLPFTSLWRHRSLKMGQILEITLFIPKFDTLNLLTEAASNEVKVMKSW